MSAADKVLRMAIEGMADAGAGAVRKASDMASPAAQKALDQVAGVVDDWGWKGGRPGEITGTDYVRAVNNFDNAKSGERRALKSVMSKSDKQFAQQLGYGNMGGRLYPPQIPTNTALGDRFNIAREFAAMERADIPREYTGAISKAIRNRVDQTGTSTTAADRLVRHDGTPAVKQSVEPLRYLPNFWYETMGHHMRSMTPQQRETFLALYPEWDGTIEDLAATARLL